MANPMDAIDMLVAANTLERAIRMSSEDGAWRVILCPEGATGSTLKRILSAVAGGSGRTAAGGRVSVATPSDGMFAPPGSKVILRRAGWAHKDACRHSSMLEEWGDVSKS